VPPTPSGKQRHGPAYLRLRAPEDVSGSVDEVPVPIARKLVFRRLKRKAANLLQHSFDLLERVGKTGRQPNMRDSIGATEAMIRRSRRRITAAEGDRPWTSKETMPADRLSE
jgi:hypothetical protein